METYKMNLIDEISEVNTTPETIPDCDTIGRKCYALTETEDKAIEYVKDKVFQLFNENDISPSDYEIKEDAFGNMVVYFFGEDRTKTIMSGSHVDSVLNGGKYDGLAGISTAYNFLEYLVKSNQKPKKNYALVAFRAEESSPKTGVACLGSSVATGLISKKDLEEIRYKGDDGEISLKEHFINRYGEEKWEGVLNSLNNPLLKKTEIERFLEVHIEQSKIIQAMRKKLALVILGVGGSRREQYSVKQENIMLNGIEATDENPYKTFTSSFIGQEAHTAGTPPNPKFNKETPESQWFRRDALVSTADFAQRILKASKLNDIPVSIASVTIPCQTGFTTVPTNQTIKFIVPESRSDDFSDILQKCSSQVIKDKEIEIKTKEESVKPGLIYALNNNQASSLLSIPLFTEEIARSHVLKQGGFGKVRATITDFNLTPETGLDFNIDYRDVDSKEAIKMIQEIYAKIDQITSNNIGLKFDKKSVSHKSFAELLEFTTEFKQKIKELLGIEFVEMASMPSHDSAITSKAGIPSSMIFIKHNGVSHNPAEVISSEDYNNAELVSHVFLAEKLGISYI